MRTGWPDVLGQGLWEVGIEPGQVQGEDLWRLDLVQLRDQPQERPWRGQAWWRLERVQGGGGRLLNLHEGIKVRGHRGWQASQQPDIALLAGQGALFPDHALVAPR